MSQDSIDIKLQIVLAHLISLKDIVAAGLRCPLLLTQSLEKAPREQREGVVAADKRIRTLFQSAEYTGRNPTSPLSNEPSSSTQASLFIAFRQAMLGTCDAPQPVGQERMPRIGNSGLMQGDERPMRTFLASPSNRPILDGLYFMLEKDTAIHDTLSFANMMWAQQHPQDFEAAAIDIGRLQSLAAAQSLSSPSRCAQEVDVTSPGSSTRAGRSSRAVDGNLEDAALESKMRYLLFLNLNLRFSSTPDQWAPLIQLRDERITALRQLRQSFDTEVLRSNISVSCFPSVVRLYNVLDTLIASTLLLNIFATPLEIAELLFEKFSNALMELQVLQHDHGDVVRNKKVNRALEDVCAEGIDVLKGAINLIHAN